MVAPLLRRLGRIWFTRISTTERMFCTMTVDNRQRTVHNDPAGRGQPARNGGQETAERGPSVDDDTPPPNHARNHMLRSAHATNHYILWFGP
jgi:hypothetical protein